MEIGIMFHFFVIAIAGALTIGATICGVVLICRFVWWFLTD